MRYMAQVEKMKITSYLLKYACYILSHIILLRIRRNDNLLIRPK